MAILETTFTNTDLDGSFVFTWTHGLNTQVLDVSWYDELNEKRDSPSIITIIDNNNVSIACGGAISGTHTIKVKYDSTLALTGRRLYELSIDNSPVNSDRLSFGQSGSTTRNIELSSFRSYLEGNLSFADTVLSNIDTATSRSNLSVYAKSETYTQSQVNALIPTSTDVTLNLTGLSSNLTVTSENHRKYGNVVNSNIIFEATTASIASYDLLGRLSVPPLVDQYFYIGCTNAGNLEGGYGYIDTSGDIRVKTGKASTSWVISLSYII